MSFIELVLFGLLVVWGVRSTMNEGMIFNRLDKLITRLPVYLSKPLGGCIVCMSSVYGTLFFISAYLAGWINYEPILFFYICYIFALSGASYIILVISD